MKTFTLALGLALCAAHVARAQEPICIVDGVRVPPSTCGIRGIKPAAIESVEVVKGQLAASLYGADAASGVVVITTKKDGAPPDADPLARYLFPPELVMAHQQAIELTDRQRAAIQQAMKEAQGKFVDAQFRLSGEMEKLQRLLRATSPDEGQVLDQVDRVLAAEREIKRTQIALMVRIKDQLTEQQQAALEKLRAQMPGGGTIRLRERPE